MFIRSALTMLVIAAGLPLAAQAQISGEVISAYNQAVHGGDLETRRAAASGAIEAARANPDDPNAGVLAFEGAWLLCKLGAPGDAIAGAELAMQLPAGDGPPLAADRALLLSYARWADNPRRNSRADLLEQLEAAVGREPTELIITAANQITHKDIEEGNWQRAVETSSVLALVSEPLSEVMPEFWAVSQLTHLVARFNHRPDISEQRDLTHLSGRIEQRLAAMPEEARGSLDTVYWQVEGWRYAVIAYLASSNQRQLSNSEEAEILAAHRVPESAEPVETVAEEPELPFCEGTLDMTPRLRYPPQNARRGMFGAVMLRFSLEEGEVSELEILASVPIDGFREHAAAAVRNWRWVPEEDPQVAGCRMSRDNIVLPVVFELN